MALATIGGWNGGNFSALLRTPEDREAFAGIVINFANTYQLDGYTHVHPPRRPASVSDFTSLFSEEYPGKNPGNGNAFDPNDTAKLFLKTLRSRTDERFIIFAATSTSPWVGADGDPRPTYVETNGQGFSKIVGPNAPPYSGCGGSGNFTSSAEGAVDAWNKAGFPLEQIGHGFRVPRSAAFLPNGQLAMKPTFAYDDASKIVGDSWDDPSSPGGTFSFLGLVDEVEWLKEDGTAASGIVYTSDACSQTSYIYDNAPQVMVSYDDAGSFEAKGRWIREKQLAGYEMFEAAGDYYDILLDDINKGLSTS
ncbi:glycoside hydrolase superfamily [Ganoderma leucocontextum]|nr:glycoside hydrolase superfamily [Ganoderma leucocontextum]